jgi:hypothetical protein
MVTHACSREVDDGRETREVAGVERSRPGIPADLGACSRLAADEVYDLVAAGAQEGRQRAADQTGGTTDGNTLRHGAVP